MSPPLQQHWRYAVAIHRSDSFFQLDRQTIIADDVSAIDIADIIANVLRNCRRELINQVDKRRGCQCLVCQSNYGHPIDIRRRTTSQALAEIH